MNLDQLRTFLAVRRRLSYTRAAVDLHLSQSATWRQVRQLEEELGVRLFDQLGKTLHLTDAGRTLAREAEQLLGHVGRVEEAVRLHATGVRGRLRIGASTTPGYYLLPAALGRFCARHPDVELHYEVENSANIEQRLLRNELDLGFVGGAMDAEDLQRERLAVDRIVCFAAAAHPLSRMQRIGPKQLAAEICVIREEGSATRQIFENWLARAGHRLERTLVIKCPEAVKTLVAAGLGFSFISIHGLGPELDSKRLVRLPVTGLRLERPITAAWHRDKALSRPMEEFLALARGASAPDRGSG